MPRLGPVREAQGGPSLSPLLHPVRPLRGSSQGLFPSCTPRQLRTLCGHSRDIPASWGCGSSPITPACDVLGSSGSPRPRPHTLHHPVCQYCPCFAVKCMWSPGPSWPRGFFCAPTVAHATLTLLDLMSSLPGPWDSLRNRVYMGDFTATSWARALPTSSAVWRVPALPGPSPQAHWECSRASVAQVAGPVATALLSSSSFSSSSSSLSHRPPAVPGISAASDQVVPGCSGGVILLAGCFPLETRPSAWCGPEFLVNPPSPPPEPPPSASWRPLGLPPLNG